MLCQNYNHHALGPTALVLGDYKSDIALVGCYNIYIYNVHVIVYYYANMSPYSSSNYLSSNVNINTVSLHNSYGEETEDWD